MRFKKADTYYIAMPGVPYEMKHIMEARVLPWIGRELRDTHIVHRTLFTQGIPESELAHRISDFEDRLPERVSLAYLPSPGKVRLRLSSMGDESQIVPQVDSLTNELRALLGDAVYSVDEEELEEVLAKLLLGRKQSLALAESCTGGYVAHRLTRIPGSSRWFKGGVVAYSNEAKQSILGVDPESIAQFGAVSQTVAEQMAAAARKVFGADFALSLTGVAGPDGGSVEKPVGTVWIGLAGAFGTEARLFRFGTDRLRNIERSALASMDWLRKTLEVLEAANDRSEASS
jgi:nicotinamide-nucleotide amidase